jgi:hypothetical protein
MTHLFRQNEWRRLSSLRLACFHDLSQAGKSQAGKPLPFKGFCPLQCGFPTCISLAFVPSFAEAGREVRLKPALFLRGYSLSPTG